MVARAHVHEVGGAPVFLFDIGDLDAPMRVLRFSGSEGLSSLFEFQVELACETQDLDFSQVVGKTALLAIRGDDGFRHLSGIISRFEQVNEQPRYAIYRATVVPVVWRLQHRHDCRIFQKLDTPAILKKVFETAGVPADRVRFSLMNTYEPRDYCVQYRESDWAFASRLMEEDGIFYFFEHHEDKHVLVLGDKESALKPIDGGETLPFRRSTGGVVQEDHVARFRRVQEVRPGRTSLRDFNFKKPGLPMEAQHEAGVDGDLEVYDYPGEYQDPGRGSSAKGTTLAKLRLEAWQASRVQGQGESDCERLSPGRLFALQEHSREDYNGRYLLTHVSHEGNQPQVMEEESQQGEFSYSNHFTCIPEKVPFRPARVTPRPYVQGGQTAVVVGPAGEEIHVDEWGRVKVQFHWDRQGKLDENSSCWVRVSQPWGGELWGRMFIPRIGQEVIVDFIEGDPDRPIITGRVYNGANLVPYELPAEKTKSTIKSNSSLNGDGYNEVRFEDEKHKEQFFMHAERNMDVHVKNDSFENIVHDRHQTIGSEGKKGKVGDQNELVYRDKSLTVHRHSQEHVGGNLKRHVGGIDGAGDVDIVIKSNRMELVHKNSHLHVKQNLNETVDATQSLQVGKDLHTSVGQLNAVEAGREIHLKSNKIVLEAASGITIQAPGGFITIDAGGIAIKGAKVLINSGGSALSGSGVKPVTPKDAVEAKPTVPALADDGKVRAPSGLAVAQGAAELKPVKPMTLAATLVGKTQGAVGAKQRASVQCTHSQVRREPPLNSETRSTEELAKSLDDEAARLDKLADDKLSEAEQELDPKKRDKLIDSAVSTSCGADDKRFEASVARDTKAREVSVKVFCAGCGDALAEFDVVTSKGTYKEVKSSGQAVSVSQFYKERQLAQDPLVAPPGTIVHLAVPGDGKQRAQALKRFVRPGGRKMTNKGAGYNSVIQEH